MLAALDVMLRVITAPNSAFADIRDDADRYFPWSLGIVVFVSALAAAIEYRSLYVIIGIIAGILSSFAFAALIYVFGRLFGGNKSWKPVFSVIFYTEIIIAPAAIVVTLIGQMQHVAFWNLSIVIAVLMPLIVWAMVVTVKAVKVVNGFGTAKAFGLIVLAIVVTVAAAAFIPFIGPF